MIDQELAASGGQDHDELVVTLKTILGFLGHALRNRLTRGLCDRRHHTVGRGQRRVDVRGNHVVDAPQHGGNPISQTVS